MIYIVNDDILKVMTQQELDQVLDGHPSALDDAEETTLDMVRDYLSDLYDIEAEFIKTDTDRSGTLVAYMVDVLLYYICMRTAPDNVPEIRMHNKEQSLKWFLQVNSGKIKLSGVDKTIAESGRPMRWGDTKTADNQLNY